MLDSVKIQRRQSEIRQTLSELVGKPELSEDETRSMETLDAEYRQNETRYRAALTAEDSERREAGADLETRTDRQFAELVAGFELRQVVLALDEGRSLTGQTAEVVAEMRNAGGYRGVPVPLAALELRNTVSGDVPNPVQTRPIIDRLFPASVAARIGVQTINITQGSVEWPVATAGAIAGWAATEGGNVPGPNPFQTAERMLAPDHTLGVHMRISRKAMKQTGDGLENAIRRDMNAAVGAELDRAVLMGSGAAGQPLGLVPGAVTYGITSTAVGAAATWAAFRAEVVAFMTANQISAASGVNVAFGPAIWSELDEALISGTAVSEWDRLTKHIPASNIALANQLAAETAILTTSAGGISPAFLGIWGGLDMIRDPYTDAQNGGLRLTGLLTADVTVARGSQIRILTGIGAP
ncbi:phage major capsid protein [Paracoccus spongiarum]|uniref:Phage major capsid protein n=1 Tax=Paracoccus spongiarum TaxID=3064387 RepID=A0ABT9JD25_9RHOB|nr:phage major capsid protein [Paracoccus sp. 2205BS29-5]MDP5307579.1 phage major capsid protein [Paracoccus sp. 2205BS29-5]